MEPEEDPLRRDMRIERVQAEDGRVLLLYSWESPASPAAGNEAGESTSELPPSEEEPSRV